MKAATGSQPKNCKVPNKQQRISFPVINRTTARITPVATPRKRRLKQHTMQSALAHLPPPDQPTNEAERRSYDTSHLNENDTILRHSGDDAEVPDDYADNSFRVYFQNVNGLKMI
jgi:hypothetical protein